LPVIFLSAKWLRKEIGKKLSLSIFVSIKNFHDRLFVILVGIGIAITNIFLVSRSGSRSKFLSSSVSLSRSRKTVIDDKPGPEFDSQVLPHPDTYHYTFSSHASLSQQKSTGSMMVHPFVHKITHYNTSTLLTHQTGNSHSG
jgi:hypothetical protein